MHQLPHKAQKLEEKLYRTAPSLESYLDRTTLKNRLRWLAKVITKQYREAKLYHQRLSLRSSVSSRSSLSSFGSLGTRDSMRDSISSQQSLDSLRSLQQQFSQKTSMPNSVGSAQHTGERRLSTDGPSSFPSTLSIVPEGSSGTQMDSRRSSSSSSSQSKGDMGKEGAGSMQSSTSQGISELERQKAVNEKLQQQIMENIRQQEDLLRKLQARSQASGKQQQQQHQPTASPSSNPVGCHLVQSMQLPTATMNTASSQLLAAQASSVEQRNNALLKGMNPLMSAQARSNLIMAQAALMNQNRFNNMQMQGAASLMAAGNANNLLQLRASQQQGLTPQQLQFLTEAARNNNNNNSSIVSSLQPTPLAAVTARQANAATGTTTFNPSMPPPPRMIQRPPQLDTQHGGSVRQDGKDAKDHTLSPGSFKW